MLPQNIPHHRAEETRAMLVFFSRGLKTDSNVSLGSTVCLLSPILGRLLTVRIVQIIREDLFWSHRPGGQMPQMDDETWVMLARRRKKRDGTSVERA